MTDEYTQAEPEQDSTVRTEGEAPGPKTDHATTPQPGSAEGRDVGQAWDDVLASVNELGDALTRWAKTAADDPENRRRLTEISNGMDEMARQAEESFNDISKSEFGTQMRQGAEQVGQVAGEAAQKVGDAAAPHVAAIFGTLAKAFGSAAQGVDDTVQRKREAAEASKPSAAADGQDAVEDEPGDEESCVE